ncbi:MAG: NAD-dependent malic enzyme [Ilumatobacter sp.]|uniref:NAD-dependent malic enzyme n=1 Tax=Ilumatobacter sp. TaxID=1967498 RepID=UPI002624ED71|nr:NAD-dependent malic enzyme [Ilumatobacter sp.]MDJ0768019.1 NAD-dependent malic enzyme [Ilumatobacter sp.]
MSRPPATQYSITLDVTLDNVPGVLGRLATTIGEAGGNIFAIEGFVAKGTELERDIVVNCCSVEHQAEIVEAVQATDGVTLEGWYDRTFRMHDGGKIEVLPLCPVGDQDDLSMAYTPGVARVCTAIADDPAQADKYTIRKNTVAIVSDGSAVLGLGDIGPKGAMPVMEGKALLFKEFGGVDAFPICLDVSSPEEIVETVVRLAPTFGGVNLEDIAAPGAFQVEEALKERLDIPVFHDDQHGTAVVALAALENALRITGKRMADLSIVMSGVGAAGVAIGKILLGAGATEIVGVDSRGAVYDGRDGLNRWKQWFAENTNPDGKQGALSDVMAGADVFIGVSAPDVLTVDDVRAMNDDPIVFAMANPDPEIRPELVDGLVRVMGTGRSDYPNQINNVLAFPGIFRGALDARATTITEGMKLAAADAIAESVTDDELCETFIMPSVFDKSVSARVATAVADAARADGVTR